LPESARGDENNDIGEEIDEETRLNLLSSSLLGSRDDNERFSEDFPPIESLRLPLNQLPRKDCGNSTVLGSYIEESTVGQAGEYEPTQASKKLKFVSASTRKNKRNIAAEYEEEVLQRNFY